ncbi:hypothetical protein YTCETSXE_CDS0047 [Staphylococcus phage MVC_VPHSA2]|nr:hypothetical protein YTCETSXE_CDS0047 [Staphylococcus phage MVC_VPHSA2]
MITEATGRRKRPVFQLQGQANELSPLVYVCLQNVLLPQSHHHQLPQQLSAHRRTLELLQRLSLMVRQSHQSKLEQLLHSASVLQPFVFLTSCFLFCFILTRHELTELNSCFTFKHFDHSLYLMSIIVNT